MSRRTKPRPAVERALACLATAAALDLDATERLRLLCDRAETWTAGEQVQPPQENDRFRLITSGWLYEARLLPDGRRQIFGYLLPGDLIGRQHATRATPSVLLALTDVEAVDLPPPVATWTEHRQAAMVEGLTRALELQEERSYDALLRLGKFTATERVANLLVELRDRLIRLDLADRESFRAPLTQEHLADTLGLSIIHVNRVLRQLRNHGVLTFKQGVVSLLQPELLERIASGVAGLAHRQPAESDS